MSTSRVQCFRFWLLVMICVLLACQSQCENVRKRSSWSMLRSDLTEGGYDVTEIPSVENGIPLPVIVHLTLQSVKDVIEKKQTIIGTFTFGLVWTDERLTWIPSNYGNQTFIILPSRMIWVPNTNLVNTNSEDSRIPKNPEDTKVHIRYDGRVFLETTVLQSTHCPMDLSRFPFDTHNCNLMFRSQDMSTSVMLVPGNIRHRDEDKPLTWDVLSVDHVSAPIAELTGYPAVSELIVIARLQRLPFHYIYVILIPAMLINVMGVFSFLIPLKSGERVSACISIVLGVTIFQIVISDAMPQTGRLNSTPETVKYLSYSFIALVGSMMCSILTLNISYRTGYIKSKALRILFFRVLASMVFKGDEGRKKMAERRTNLVMCQPQIKSDETIDCPFQEGTCSKTPPKTQTSKQEDSSSTDMEVVAGIFDRIFFVTFLAVEIWMLSMLGSLFLAI
nr:neuronal acetylcholine receptor subunit alpha-3-like [Lytechinus pictus]